MTVTMATSTTGLQRNVRTSPTSIIESPSSPQSSSASPPQGTRLENDNVLAAKELRSDYLNQARNTTSTSSMRITGMAKWEGRILDVDPELMTAELTPLDHHGPTLVADFQTNLLGEDAQLAEPGDVFYLTVRTVRDRFGRPSPTEHLRLRRLGTWTSEEVERLHEQAAKDREQIESLFG